MPEHEEKRCPRCGGPFLCKQGNIQECHCAVVKLDAGQRLRLAERYADCLCGKCLAEAAIKIEERSLGYPGDRNAKY